MFSQVFVQGGEGVFEFHPLQVLRGGGGGEAAGGRVHISSWSSMGEGQDTSCPGPAWEGGG